MYKDVVEALSSAFSAGDCKGYVLDGELIVVDEMVVLCGHSMATL